MRLAVFDIDGTLTAGRGAGTDCFFRAFDTAFGIRHEARPLAEYRHQTDRALAIEVIADAWGRAPTEAELDRHRRVYVESFDKALAEDAALYRPINGAAEALRRLRADDSWAVTVATGNWRDVAARKLAAIGLDLELSTAGCAEDGESRAEILGAAIERGAGSGSADRAVYVGDRLWDLEAAATVGAGFVGVGVEARSLADAGASASFVDYADYDAFLNALESA